MCVAKIADGHYDNDEECKFKSLLPQLQATKCPSPNPSLANCHGGLTDFWYPDYDTAWSIAGCKNTLPLPYNNPNDRPNYDTHIACCKGAYAGQVSGACLSELESPPTTSPTNEGNTGSDYYPDYSLAWPEGKCINKLPVPSGRPTYSTKIACCSGAYGGQVSQTCIGDANPCYSCKFAIPAIDDIWNSLSDHDRMVYVDVCVAKIEDEQYDNDKNANSMFSCLN